MIIKNQKKILPLILIIVIIVFGALVYFYYLGKKPVDNQYFVLGADTGIMSEGPGQEPNISKAGKDLLKTLNVLRSIKLDTGFFKQEVFQGLIDFSQELPYEEKGRLNPFRPIGI